MRIKSLQFRARIVVQGFLSGLHRSPHHGFSVEFSEYRQYSPGDDPRYLDWKLFARSDRYYIKRFEDETNLRCHLLVDLSRSMGYGSLKYAKVAGRNPWGATGLEWGTTSPPPADNFEKTPIVTLPPYVYSKEEAPAAGPAGVLVGAALMPWRAP